MEEPVTNPSTELARIADPLSIDGRVADAGELGRALCHYCGAPLDHRFYFCTACSTPFRNVEEVIPPPAPLYLSEGALIQKKTPQVITVFWTYFGVLLFSFIAAHFLFGEDRPEFRLLFEVAALAVTTCVVGVIYWRSLAPQLKKVGFFRREAWYAMAALAPLLGINYLYHSWLFRMLASSKDSHPHIDKLEMGQAAVVLLFCAFPAVTEELAFRGLLQHWLSTALRPFRAIVIASALFTAMHFVTQLPILSAPYLFAVGCLLGWAKWKTGSLYPSMVMHFLHNLIVIECFHLMR